ncbi:MAG: Hybrid sensor histidine kinase [Cyanobacteria bacterium RYN_339]|nr:Hybrid sensor histidine kinase [Cyanobacteria bacterium RYN_339]
MMKNLQVLVVDDEPMNLDLALAVLAREGHEITLVTNGQEALDACAAREFDLILMDINMPVMDGYTATRQLRDRGTLSPIMFVTGSTSGGEEQVALEAGGDLFMRKPYRRQQLLDAIGQVLATPRN